MFAFFLSFHTSLFFICKAQVPWNDFYDTGGTLIPSGDDDISAPISLNFEFPIAKSFASHLSININGYVNLYSGSAWDHKIGPFRVDLETTSGGTVILFWLDLTFEVFFIFFSLRSITVKHPNLNG